MRHFKEEMRRGNPKDPTLTSFLRTQSEVQNMKKNGRRRRKDVYI
jgi:hypothetical protein